MIATAEGLEVPKIILGKIYYRSIGSTTPNNFASSIKVCKYTVGEVSSLNLSIFCIAVAIRLCLVSSFAKIRLADSIAALSYMACDMDKPADTLA